MKKYILIISAACLLLQKSTNIAMQNQNNLPTIDPQTPSTTSYHFTQCKDACENALLKNSPHAMLYEKTMCKKLYTWYTTCIKYCRQVKFEDNPETQLSYSKQGHHDEDKDNFMIWWNSGWWESWGNR